jgi:hypothetical protein
VQTAEAESSKLNSSSPKVNGTIDGMTYRKKKKFKVEQKLKFK